MGVCLANQTLRRDINGSVFIHSDLKTRHGFELAIQTLRLDINESVFSHSDLKTRHKWECV